MIRNYSLFKFHARAQSILLSALKEPIPREVLDYILKQHNIKEVFEW